MAARQSTARTAQVPAAGARPGHDADYEAFRSRVERTFADSALHGALFCTGAEGLYETYLEALPGERQTHTCHCCKRFFEQYGGLAVVMPGGVLQSALWQPDRLGLAVPAFYGRTQKMLAKRVAGASITGVFLSKEEVLGSPQTGSWTHYWARNPEPFKHRVSTPFQRAAEVRENYLNVVTALQEFTLEMLEGTLGLFETESLARSEKFVGPVRWLHDLQAARMSEANASRRDNLTWAAVASAPNGYCHPRSSVIGPLISEVAEGTPFAVIKRKFGAMLDPLQYQRPQAAPSAGTIANAEKIFEKMGLEPALHRRFARLDELRGIKWTPRHRKGGSAAPGGGVFSHIQPKALAEEPVTLTVPAQTMTWVKFRDTVLGGAERIAMLVPRVGSFIALTTALHDEAPPILK
jgi:hypothetical protein